MADYMEAGVADLSGEVTDALDVSGLLGSYGLFEISGAVHDGNGKVRMTMQIPCMRPSVREASCKHKGPDSNLGSTAVKSVELRAYNIRTAQDVMSLKARIEEDDSEMYTLKREEAIEGPDFW